MCEACNGYGFILANHESKGPLTIQRCDACNDSNDDSTVTAAVYWLARSALDFHDVAVLYHQLHGVEGDSDWAECEKQYQQGYHLLRSS